VTRITDVRDKAPCAFVLKYLYYAHNRVVLSANARS
jgi:hypothetical protein